MLKLCDRRDQWYHQRHYRRERTVNVGRPLPNRSPSVALDPVGGQALPREDDALADSLRFCRYARTYVCSFRRLARKNLRFWNGGKFSERRSERPDVSEASSSRPAALRTRGKGACSHTTDSSYALRFKDFTFNPQNVFTGWRDHYGRNNRG
jgi:hypothetical protein